MISYQFAQQISICTVIIDPSNGYDLQYLSGDDRVWMVLVMSLMLSMPVGLFL